MSPTPFSKRQQVGVRRKRKPKGLKRGKRINPINPKRGGSLFPKERDKPFTDWVCTEPCVGANKLFTARVTLNDWMRLSGQFRHVCWGDMTPMHVGKHRAQGVGDVGRVVPACEGLHRFYDTQRARFYRVTRISEKRLEHIAHGLPQKYVERGGKLLAPQDGKAA